MTFKPKILENSKKIDKCKGRFRERLKVIEEKEKAKHEKLEQIRKQNEFNELRKCTFSPTINNKPGKKRLNHAFERLHEQHEIKNTIRNKLFKEKQTQDVLNEINQCSFHPKVNSNISPKSIPYNHLRINKAHAKIICKKY